MRAQNLLEIVVVDPATVLSRLQKRGHHRQSLLGVAALGAVDCELGITVRCDQVRPADRFHRPRHQTRRVHGGQQERHLHKIKVDPRVIRRRDPLGDCSHARRGNAGHPHQIRGGRPGGKGHRAHFVVEFRLRRRIEEAVLVQVRQPPGALRNPKKRSWVK